MCSLELRDYAAKLAALLQCDRASIWRVAQGGGGGGEKILSKTNLLTRR